MKQVDFGLVIACYNEVRNNGDNFIKNVEEIDKILDNTKYSYEIIFVDDCSQDSTRKVIKQLVKKHKNFKYLFHEKNKGRGGAVMDGIKISNSKVSGFIDIDLEIPAHNIPILINKVIDGADLATGLRSYKFGFLYLKATHRFLAHKIYKFLVKILLRTKLKDTETGCKFFNTNNILPVLDEIEDTHWFWDTEIMIRSYFKGLKIKEIPVNFTRIPESGSTLKFFSDSYIYFKNLIKFLPKVKKMRKKWKNQQLKMENL